MDDKLTLEEVFEEHKTTKRTRRRKKGNEPQKLDDNLHLSTITPRTEHQKEAFGLFKRSKNLLLLGSAGTGKTFISLYLALQELLDKDTDIKRIVIVRSAVPTRDIGFLPGGTREKLEVYEAPYESIFNELFGRADAYGIMKLKRLVSFVPTSFIRGTTIPNSIIIVDECSNLTGHELDSIITRVGDNSKIIFCGDFNQSDFTKTTDKTGLKDFVNILDGMSSFAKVVFDENDIVRSGLVRDYIISKNSRGITF